MEEGNTIDFREEFAFLYLLVTEVVFFSSSSSSSWACGGENVPFFRGDDFTIKRGDGEDLKIKIGW